MRPFADPAVEAAFGAAPEGGRAGMLRLREQIFAVAVDTPGAMPLTETLKWGQPAYLTANKAGTTLRLGAPKEGGYALYVHCQTRLIADFEALFPDDFTYEGTRAVHFQAGEAPDPEKLARLIRAALTYHAKKRAA